MQALTEKLKRQVDGEVLTDTFSKKIYSTDASIYLVEPLGVFYPKHEEDVLRAVELADQYEVPLIPRGAATGTAGGCLGSGLVIDFSKYMNKILAIDPETKIAVCQPGVVQESLNDAVRPYGLRLGPNTSTGNRATLGGMVAANSAGAHSLRYGMMEDAMVGVELICSTGEKVAFTQVTPSEMRSKLSLKGMEGRAYRLARRLGGEHKKAIQKAYPNIPRKVSGYNLLPLIESEPHFPKFFAGSEGTLGLITQMTTKLAPFPKFTGICVLPFNGLDEAFSTVKGILNESPYAFEMIDKKIIEAGKSAPMMRGKTRWIQGDPEILFFVELDGETKEELEEKLARFLAKAKQKKWGSSPFTLSDQREIKNIWELREAGLGLLMAKRSYERAIAFIEDLALPPLHLKEFLPPFLSILKKYHKEAGFYGHVGAGCLHIRPYIDLRKEEELKTMQAIMEETTELVKLQGGVLSGEHGDGLVRSWLNPKLFSKEIYSLFEMVKKTFDPKGIFNPGKVVNGPPLTQNLRTSPQSKQTKISTFLSFEKEGGFELSVDMCNGNGQCRKNTGLMCPTFQATKDDHFSTRGRAQALRAIISKELPEQAFVQKELFDILDWCIECKGCKTQCPSEVDMAKMKSEFLYHYQKANGFTLRSKLFAHIHTLSKAASWTPSLANYFAPYLLPLFGIASERSLPQFAKRTFSRLFKSCRQKEGLKKKAYLFIDTYTEFNTPEIGLDAVKVLNALGFYVLPLAKKCCGRPMLSKGFLPQAKKTASSLYPLLRQAAKEEIPVVGLEPSCLFTIKDDFKDLLDTDKQVMNNIWYFDTFIEALPHKLKLKESEHAPLIHRHCYHKAIEERLSDQGPIPEGKVLPTGCCGMAGSFGYEKEHAAFSKQIAKTTLLPYLPQNLKGVIVANGLSCRSQIKDLVGKKPLHLAQFLASNMV